MKKKNPESSSGRSIHYLYLSKSINSTIWKHSLSECNHVWPLQRAPSHQMDLNCFIFSEQEGQSTGSHHLCISVVVYHLWLWYKRPLYWQELHEASSESHRVTRCSLGKRRTSLMSPWNIYNEILTDSVTWQIHNNVIGKVPAPDEIR